MKQSTTTFLSIKKILLILIFVFCIAYSLVTYASYQYIAEEKTQASISLLNEVSEKTKVSIDNYIDSLATISKITTEHSYRSTYSYTLKSELMLSNEQGNISPKAHVTLLQYLDTMMYANPNIHSAAIINLHNDYVLKLKNGLSLTELPPLNPQWISFATDIKNYKDYMITDTYTMESTHSFNSTTVENKKTKLFGLVRGIINYEYATIPGVILLNTKLDYLDTLIGEYRINNSHKIFLLNNSKPFFTSSCIDGCKTFDGGDEMFEFFTTMPHNTAMKKSFAEGDILAVKTTFNNTPWEMIQIVPMDSITKSIQLGKSTIWIITLAGSLFSIILLGVTSNYFTYQLEKLIGKINSNSSNLKTIHEPFVFSELTIIRDEINSQVKHIHKLFDEIVEHETKEAKLELQMLQNQINPHFLYNTLEAIHMNAKINDDPTTGEMIIVLSELLRYSIRNSMQMVTLEEELAYTEKYIWLLKLRFEDTFECNFDIDEDILDAHVPKIIFQPLIENAILHAFNNLEKGIINFSGKLTKDNTIEFIIEDNGVGMDEKTVAIIQNHFNSVDSTQESIGLSNIHLRIINTFGKKYGLSIESIQGQSTTIKLCIPYIE